MKTIIKLMALFAFLITGYMATAQTQTFSTAGTSSWTAPAGVTSVTVQAWGGGGGGGSASSSANGKGGGGGGAYAGGAVTVVPGTSYTIVVGAGGQGGTSSLNGASGTSSTFNTSSIVAVGGTFANNSTGSGAGGAGGLASACTGTVKGSGGTGGTGNIATSGGGGGGGASGTASGAIVNGSNASGGTGGAGGNGVDGDGGAGGNTNNSGVAGAQPGGGGGGRGDVGSVSGDGGDGKIILTWTCNTYALTATSNSGACSSVGTSTITLTGLAAGLPVGTYTVTYNRGTPSATGLTASMTVSVAGSGTFSATGLTTAGTSLITITNLTSGAVGGTCGNAISANNTTTVTVSAAPTAVAGTAVSTCSTSGAVNITAGSSATNAASTTWTSSGTGTFANATSLTTCTYTPSAADISAGSVTITLTSTPNSPCASNATSNKTLTITTAPTAVSGTAVATCSTNGAVNITAGSSASGAATTTWTSSGTGTFANATSLTTCTYTPSAADISAGSVTITLTSTPNSPCASNATSNKTLTITTAPTAVSGTAVTTCSTNGAVNITAGSSATNNASITWSTSNGTGTFANATSLTTCTYTPSAADISAGSRTLVLTAIGNGTCANATSNKTITITSAPTAVAGTAVSTCSNSGAVNITAGSSATNAASTTWTSSGTGTFANATSLTTCTYTPSAADISAGSVTLTLTSTPNSPCAANATSNKTLTINQAPTSVAGTAVTTCSTSGAVNITAGSSASNNSGITWSTSNGTGTFANPTSLTTCTYTPSAADISAGSRTLVLTATALAGCTNATSNKTITITSAPTAAAGTAVSTCANSGAVNITAGSSAGNAATTTWTSSGTGTFANANSLTTCTYTPSAADISAGSVTITLTSTPNAPCAANATSNKTLTINQPPASNAGTAVTTCSNSGAVNITAGSSATNQASVAWTSSGTGTFANATSLTTCTYNPSAADISAGSVTLTLTANANAGCSNATSSKTLTINQAPTAVAGTAISTCGYLTAVNITAGSSATNNAGITWTCNGTGTFANATSLTTCTYTPSAADIAAGSRTLTLTATGNTSCGNATSTKTITFIALPSAVSASPASTTVCASATSTALTGAATTSASSTISNENFNGTPAYTVAGSNSGGGQAFLQKTSPATAGLTSITNNDGSKFMIAVAASFGSASTNSQLISPVINTTGYSSLSFTFRHTYQKGSETGVSLQVSTDVGNTVWSNVNTSGTIIGTNTYTSNQGTSSNFVAATFNLTPFINNANLKIRFNFVSNVSGATSWWAIDDAALNGVPVALYSWTSNTGSGVDGLPGGAGTASIANKNITVVPSATTTYTVTATDAVTGCTNTSTATVTVNPVATVSAGSAQTICEGSTATMNGSFGGGASSATWSSSGTGSFNNNNGNAIYTPSAADISAGSVSLTYTTNDPAGPCGSVNASMTLTINPAATVSAGSAQTICEGSTATMNGSFGGGASSATWSSSGTGSFNNNNVNAVYTPSAADVTAGSVSLTYTTNDPAGPCGSVNASMTLTINPAATVSAGSAQTICEGSTATMNGSFGGGASSATWSSSGTGSFNNNSVNAVYTPSAADVTAGSVSLTYTTDDPSGPCGSVNASMTLTINPAATVSAGSAQTICEGSTATMNGSFGGGASSATWSSSGTGSFNNNNVNAVYTPSAADVSAGSVALTYTTDDPSGPCGSVNASMTLTINPVATVSAGSAQTICEGSTATMNGSFGGGASSATWSSSGTGSFNNNNVNAVYTPSAADVTAGSVVLTYTTDDPSGPCGSVNASMTLTINPVATVSAGANQTVCSGSTATMNGSFGGGASSATWSSSGTGSFNNNNVNAVYTPSAADVTAGSVSLTYTTDDPSGPCGSVNASMTLTIEAPATVNANVDQIICASSTVTLSGSFGGSATGGNWTTNGDGSFDNANTMSAVYTPGVNDIANGQVNLTLTATGSAACSASDVMKVAIHSSVPATPGVVTGAIAVCPPANNMTYSVPASSDADSYSWSLGVNTNAVTFNGSTSGNAVSINFGTTSNTTYSIKVNAVNACGVSVNTSNILVRRAVSAPASIAGATFACGNDVKVYSCPTVTGATGYLWSAPTGCLIDGNPTPYNSPNNSVNITFPAGFTGGSVSVASTIACFTSVNRTVTIVNTPAQPGVIGGSSIGCPGNTVTYSVASVPGAVSYQWTLPSGASGSSVTNSINVSFNNSFNFGNISVTVTNVCGLTSVARTKGLTRGTPPVPATINAPNGLAGLCNQTTTMNITAITGATSYTWSLPAGGTINSGQGSTSINASFGVFGSANVCVTANNACGSSATRCVIAKGSPTATGNITYAGPICLNSSGIDFQIASVFGTVGYNWTFPSGTSSVLDLGNEQIVNWGNNAGTVSVTMANACGNTTKSIAISFGCRTANTSEGTDISNDEFSLFPNPAHDQLNISFASQSSSSYVLNIQDLSGRAVYSMNNNSVEGLNSIKIDLNKFSKGIYMVQIIQNDGKSSKKKLVIE